MKIKSKYLKNTPQQIRLLNTLCDGHLVIFMSLVGTNSTYGNFGFLCQCQSFFCVWESSRSKHRAQTSLLCFFCCPLHWDFSLWILCCATVLVITFPVSLISSSFENSLPLSNVVSISPVFWKVWTEIQAWFHLVGVTNQISVSGTSRLLCSLKLPLKMQSFFGFGGRKGIFI